MAAHTPLMNSPLFPFATPLGKAIYLLPFLLGITVAHRRRRFFGHQAWAVLFAREGKYVFEFDPAIDKSRSFVQPPYSTSVGLFHQPQQIR